MKRYQVKEVFATLQGEGALAGTAAVFVRFAGCNLWTGRSEDRAADADRHEAQCPEWCDTDFRGGKAMTREELAREVSAECASRGWGTRCPLVVLTGGEPGLQVDHVLVEALRLVTGGARIAIETNGTCSLPGNLNWVCVSPKTAPNEILVRRGHELKVVFPSYDPLEYDQLAEGFTHRFVSPQAVLGPAGVVGESLVDADNVAAAARFCLMYPDWRLSVQTHKVVGLR